ncbi:MAG: RluA family pseudouridine synthase [Ruminococcaceae bacterium]|nr:RluA family pseudouridine synthase [Oscillospiraceae bacterium]
MILTIECPESGLRIDAYLAEELEGMTRSGVQKLIEAGNVTLGGKAVKKNHKTTQGETFLVEIPEPKEAAIAAENIPLEVAYEDDDLIVINKPRGMVVHPAPGHYEGTLVNALMYHCGDSLSGINGELRPGIVHRIDKDTSGLIIAAKNDFAHLSLAEQLKDHSLCRVYEAVVWGHFRDDEGTVDAPIGRHHTDRKRMAVTERNSREAITHYRVLARYRNYSHIQCRLETGRTHQIRVHMAYIGHPCLGDPVYGRQSPEKGLDGQCLHARRLQFIHPRTEKMVEVTTELPAYFREVLSKLGNEE